MPAKKGDNGITYDPVDDYPEDPPVLPTRNAEESALAERRSNAAEDPDYLKDTYLPDPTDPIYDPLVINEMRMAAIKAEDKAIVAEVKAAEEG